MFKERDWAMKNTWQRGWGWQLFWFGRGGGEREEERQVTEFHQPLVHQTKRERERERESQLTNVTESITMWFVVTKPTS